MYSTRNEMKATGIMFDNASKFTERETGVLNTTLLAEWVCHAMCERGVNVWDGNDVPEWLFDLAAEFSYEWDDIKHDKEWEL